MSTGIVHPLASQPIISHVQIEPDPDLSYTVQISAEYLGILFSDGLAEQNDLIIWNWKTGAIELVSRIQHFLYTKPERPS